MLPPLRDEELPPLREPPPDIPPDERMVLDDDERIVLDEEDRDGVVEVLTLEREGCVRVVVLTLLLRVALVRVGAAAVR